MQNNLVPIQKRKKQMDPMAPATFNRLFNIAGDNHQNLFAEIVHSLIYISELQSLLEFLAILIYLKFKPLGLGRECYVL